MDKPNPYGKGWNPMSKITLSEALELVPVGRSKLYNDAADGTISTEKNKQGTKVVDVAELERVYGKLRNPQEDNETSKMDGHGHHESPNGHPPSSNGLSPQSSGSVQILELQVSMLEDPLQHASDRELALITEKDKLIEREDKLVEMLRMEQEKTRQLMLPPPPQIKGSFWNLFRVKR